MAGNLVEELLRACPALSPALEQPAGHEVQVLYTQIDRDAQGLPHFTPHAYRVDPAAYFYPASIVKLAGAAMALEKLNQLDIQGLDKHTPLRIDSAFAGQVAALHDLSAPTGKPSIAHYIKKLFVVSDNDAYNRLYEFVGQQPLNEGLWEKGYGDLRLLHRLSTFSTEEESRHTNPLTFYRDGQVIYQQPAACNPHIWRAPAPILRGQRHWEGEVWAAGPEDFAGWNYMSLEVAQELLKALLFPQDVAPERRFALSEDDYQWLWHSMSVLPRECRAPRYGPRYHDSWVKFLLFGDRREAIPPHIRIFNKVGLAYGYMSDTAFVVDFEAGVEYLLAAVVNTDPDSAGGGRYAYEQVGFPFLGALGRTIHEYERQRPRAHPARLEPIRLDYNRD
jgi:hypothetical protein